MPTFGRCLHGPLRGARLDRLPVYQSPWSEWKDLRPDTLVAAGTGESREGHGSQFPDPDSSVLPPYFARLRTRHDARLPDLELVLGVEMGGRARAYPLALLREFGPVFEDTIAGTPIVLYTRPAGWISVAFERTLDGRTLAFRPAADGKTMVDAESGSRFDLTGTALSGPFAGRQLRFVLSGVEKWCAWSEANPETELLSPGAGAGP